MLTQGGSSCLPSAWWSSHVQPTLDCPSLPEALSAGRWPLALTQSQCADFSGTISEPTGLRCENHRAHGRSNSRLVTAACICLRLIDGFPLLQVTLCNLHDLAMPHRNAPVMPRAPKLLRPCSVQTPQGKAMLHTSALSFLSLFQEH